MIAIANPIYDSVFKYLLEDTEIARGLLAAILNRDIVSIEVKPQETAVEVTSHTINIFRLDFKAVIRTASGERQKVLIELQKSKHLLDIMRFRRYLADNYQKEDVVTLENGETESVPLHIVTVYFLGFALAKGYPKVFRAENNIVDVATGRALTERPREPFVELLNHESYVIQIPLLKAAMQTPLERLLTVFNQENILNDDRHRLSYEGEAEDPLLKKMVDRLNRAAADEQLRKQMDVEDEVDKTIRKLLRDRDRIIDDRDKTIEEKDKTIEEKEALIAELMKKLNERL